MRGAIETFRRAIKEEGQDIIVACGSVGLWEKEDDTWVNVDLIPVESYREIIKVLEQNKSFLKY